MGEHRGSMRDHRGSTGSARVHGGSSPRAVWPCKTAARQEPEMGCYKVLRAKDSKAFCNA